MGDKDYYDEKEPAHTVTMDDFYIGKYEVTQKQWKAVMGSNPSSFIDDDLPVESVSWNDVQDFIENLNNYTGENYRLPTEAEWEFAARGGNQSKGYRYSGSDDYDDVAWCWKNSGDIILAGKWEGNKEIPENNCRTHPVGQKQANELGLHDMSGNVYEMCNDWYGLYSSEDQYNPQGSSEGGNRVIRGGDYIDLLKYCEMSDRSFCDQDEGSSVLGLRLVKDSQKHNASSFYSHHDVRINTSLDDEKQGNDKWKEIMGANPSTFTGCDDCPVESVNWSDIQEFIRKINHKTGKSYRLPTEAEWEYAAKGGLLSKGYVFSGSNNVQQVAWCYRNSGEKTHPIGQKLPNELGIFDMSGNVWEICEDNYGGYSSDSQTILVLR